MLAIGVVLFIALLIAKLVRFFTSDPQPLWKEEYMGKEGSNSRRLGIFEDMFVYLCSMGINNLSNIIFVRSKKEIRKEQVEMALENLAMRQPLLRSCICKEQDSEFYWFKPMENFQVPLKVAAKADWKGLLEEELLENHNIEKGPLWRVTFIPKTDYDDDEENSEDYCYQMAFIFSFHHGVVDGISYSHLYGEFIQKLHDINTGYERYLQPFDLLPPVEAFVEQNVPYTWGQNIMRKITQLLAQSTTCVSFIAREHMKTPRYIKKHGSEIDRNPKVTPKTTFLPRNLSRDQTARLKKACKKNGTTVHGALVAAANIAYSLLCQDQTDFLEDTTVKNATAINMRTRMKGNVSSHYIGNCIAVADELSVKLGPESSFWEVARSYIKDLNGFIDGNGPMNFYNQLSDIASGLKELLPNFHGRTGEILVTNLGHLKYVDAVNARCDIKVTARYGCAAEHRMGCTFVNNIATVNGKLFWTFTYFTNVTSEDQVKAYADLATTTLLANIVD